MPINPLRPSPNFTVASIGTGSIMDANRLNGFQNAMSNFAGRGAHVVELPSNYVNGRIVVPLGVVSKGFANSFKMDKKSIAVPLWVPAGYDMLTLMYSVRLGPLKTVSGVPDGVVGSAISIEIVQGGTGRVVQEISWRSTMLDTLGNGYFEGNVPLSNIFNLSPIHADLIFIRLNYTMVEGYDALLGLNTSGVLNNPEFWQGFGYFGAACYKSIEPC